MATETCGTLNLKVARLERQLELFREQLSLSSKYPDHSEKLKQCVLQLQAQLEVLGQRQRKLALDKHKEVVC